MSLQKFTLSKEFNAPIDTVFEDLTDHNKFGALMPASIKRVVDSTGENVNGVGSVRSIKLPLASKFEETVVAYEKNKLMEYTITRGTPIKNHLGSMKFSESNGKTLLEYTIQLEPKVSLPFLGTLLKMGLKKSMGDVLDKLARRY